MWIKTSCGCEYSSCIQGQTKHTMDTPRISLDAPEICLVFFGYCVGQNVAAGAGRDGGVGGAAECR